jgi:mitogen-activated protein kinase kinase kinase 7
MSPEQLNRDNYNEKCDVYSYSIIIWEIMTRQKPYFNLPDVSFWNMMFGVVQRNLRPIGIANCPPILKLLLKVGMDGEPKKRPSMQLILNLMKKIDQLINKEPIKPICEIKQEFESKIERSISTSVSMTSSQL